MLGPFNFGPPYALGAFYGDDEDEDEGTTPPPVDPPPPSTGDDPPRTRVTVSPPFSEDPLPGSIWTLESNQLYAQTFRVLSVTEREGITFDVVAVQHEFGKYDAVDFGTVIQERPISVIPASVQPPPASVALSCYYVIEQGMASYVMEIKWPPALRAVAYEIEWRRDSGEWVKGGRTGSTSYEVRGIYRGRYLARVRALNALSIPSIWANSTETQLDGKTTAPPSLAFLTATTNVLFGIEIKWGFPDVPLDISRTEIFHSLTPSFDDAIRMGDFAFPTTKAALWQLTAGAERWFWGRMVDTSGNIGPFVPLQTNPGAFGQSSSSAADILEYLEGQILRTQLGADLLEVIEGAETAIVQVEEIESDIAAMYTIKTQLNVNGRRYIAGIGVGVENANGIIESQVLVMANRFAILDPTGAAVSVPFAVTGGQVFINSAFIQNGSITTAKIQDAAITNAKIGAASIDRAKIVNGEITTALIGDAQITTAKIQDAAVQTLKIAGNAVTVTSYNSGGSGLLPRSGGVNLLDVYVDMGTSAGIGGVVIQGHASLMATSGNATNYMQIIRLRDGAILNELAGSFMSGYVMPFSIFAFDPAPQNGSNGYRLRIFNAPDGTGAGDDEDSTIWTSTFMAVGGKR